MDATRRPCGRIRASPDTPGLAARERHRGPQQPDPQPVQKHERGTEPLVSQANHALLRHRQTGTYATRTNQRVIQNSFDVLNVGANGFVFVAGQ